MFVAWVLFPLVLLAVSLGCGLAVERVGGWPLPGGLLPSVGLALAIVAATLTTSTASTAGLTTPVVVALALAGYGLGWRRVRGLRPEAWAVAVGIGVFAVCAAPVVLSGNATFLGYFVDNDGSFHFALTDHLLAHGRDLAGLPPSTYSSLLHSYISTAYPTGTDVALGALRPLVGQDVAWIFQPYLAVILALGGVAIYELLRTVVRSKALRAACAFIAAQSGLVYAFYLEGSIKELATTWVITVIVALVVLTLRRGPSLRRAVPLVITAIAALDILDLAIVPWVGVPLAVFVVITAWRMRHSVREMATRRLVLATAGSAAVVAALAAPIISKASTFFTAATGTLDVSGAAGGSQTGNLASPLPKWQILGIWPVPDFRYPITSHSRLAFALIGVALASAVLGTLWMIRRRAYGPLMLLAGSGLAAIYLLGRSSPYAASKVMMIFSLTAVLTAMLGGAALYDSGRRIEGWALAGVIGAAVLWTNVLGYQGMSVAPRARFAELAAVGSRFSGEGPTFYNQADEYAVYFLRREAPTVPFAFGPGPVPRAGLPARNGDQVRLPWDANDLAPSYLQSFRLLVLGRSPLAAPPPADFTLAYRGRYYDVWRRTASPQIIDHVSLGNELDHGAVPNCRLVGTLAADAARDHATLAYSESQPDPVLVPTQAPALARAWGPIAGNPYEVAPAPDPGPVTGSVTVGRAARYQVWLAASLNRHVSVSVGGRRIGSVAYRLGPPDQYVRVGQVSLPAGKLPVVISPSGTGLEPGQKSYVQLMGPLVLVPDGPSSSTSEIAPSDARSLCGRWLNWIEIVRGPLAS